MAQVIISLKFKIITMDTGKDFGQKSMIIHKQLGGRIGITSKLATHSKDDLPVAYTPGVAAPCTAIAEDPEKVWELTIKKNTVAAIALAHALETPRKIMLFHRHWRGRWLHSWPRPFAKQLGCRQPPFSPRSSGPRAASRPSRQKQIPSSTRVQDEVLDDGEGGFFAAGEKGFQGNGLLWVVAAFQEKDGDLPSRLSLVFQPPIMSRELEFFGRKGGPICFLAWKGPNHNGTSDFPSGAGAGHLAVGCLIGVPIRSV
jgi:hypothetical protein